jgi:hypothetical protein
MYIPRYIPYIHSSRIFQFIIIVFLNDYTDDEDEYNYVTYACKYFGDQIDNEIIYTPYSPQPA